MKRYDVELSEFDNLKIVELTNGDWCKSKDVAELEAKYAELEAKYAELESKCAELESKCAELEAKCVELRTCIARQGHVILTQHGEVMP